MNRQSVLVVEDEPIIADDIATSLEGFGYAVHGIAASVDEAVTVLGAGLPDMALVDINLEGEKTGVELGYLLHNRFKTPFMYITSYFDEETVERVKKTHPVAYLIKPFDDRDLRVNLDLAFARQKKRPFPTDKIFVKKANRLIALDPQAITHVEAIDNYAFVYTADGKYMISHTLKSIEEKLMHRGFVRVHRSYLINFEHISSVSEGFILLGNTQIPLGRAYKQAFLEYLVTL